MGAPLRVDGELVCLYGDITKSLTASEARLGLSGPPGVSLSILGTMSDDLKKNCFRFQKMGAPGGGI